MQTARLLLGGALCVLTGACSESESSPGDGNGGMVASGGVASGGAASGGLESTGGTSGGATSGGATSGGATSGGATSAGAAGTTSSGGMPSEWAAACEAAAEVYCGKIEDCSPYVAAVQGAPDCRDFHARFCVELSTAPGFTATSDEYAACFAAIAAMSCDDWAYTRLLAPECRLGGEAPDESPCASDFQCQSGVCSGSTSACGVCESVPAEGEECVADGCARGFDCLGGVCEQRKRAGDPCSADSPCPTTMSCRDGLCARPPLVGEPCDPDVPFGCDILRKARCDDDTSLCEEVPFATLGEECVTYCQDGGVCSSSTEPSTCAPRRAEGERCDLVGDGVCQPLLACEDGFCTRAAPAECE